MRILKYGEWEELSNTEIAKELSCSRGAINSLRKGETWRDI